MPHKKTVIFFRDPIDKSVRYDLLAVTAAEATINYRKNLKYKVMWAFLINDFVLIQSGITEYHHRVPKILKDFINENKNTIANHFEKIENT